jgi:DNA mismatch endonuclease (patch repair protein)
LATRVLPGKRVASAAAPSFRGLRPASEAASRSKRANRKTDSSHELLLRRQLTKLGLRYRKYAADLPGKPDIVFRTARVAVFCDGDFWHGRHWVRLKRYLSRRHNGEYWIAKIARNRERDRDISRKLAKAGWHVIRIWETDILRNPATSALLVDRIVRGRSPLRKAAQLAVGVLSESG